MRSLPAGFAGRIVSWQQEHGRNDLPWQAVRDPYRVWLSEIMLQQTQVSTVLDYYRRFVTRFPDVAALAAASEDEVLAHWSGLGYYSRARNLHHCARQIMDAHGGSFPRSALELEQLPGIGRSTAAAIAAFCFGERAAILDGNVRRVLTRVLGFDLDLARPANERELWTHAQALLPRDDPEANMPRYTQGLMDLGATVCVSRNPDCARCPVRTLCAAHAQGHPQAYPVKTRKLKRTAQSLWVLSAHAPDGAVWLQKRPARGIWAGLHCLPVYESADALEAELPRAEGVVHGEAFLHVLTHKDLHLHPVHARLRPGQRPQCDGAWVSPQGWRALGLPAPIRRLLEERAGD